MTALTRLRLTDFRNYAALDLALDARPVCLVGPNGAGKTNILEAVSQLGPGRGLRSAALVEMVRSGAAGGWTVAADVDDRRVGVAIERTGASAKRIVRIDGAPAAPSDLAELLRVVWLTPAMDRVWAGGAGDRRRFLDRQVMAHIPSHGRAAGAYEAAMRERNALLERGAPDPAWADAIEARMAEAGAQISWARAKVVQALQDTIDAAPDGAFPKADLGLDGAPERQAAEGASTDEIEIRLKALWRDGRRRDAAAGRTLDGPHRTDLTAIHRPTTTPAGQCSTGQQKALLMGVILASGRALSKRDGPSAILLLDEAAAHLDADRRAALFDELLALPGQAWLTGTESYLFEAFGERAQKFEIRASEAVKL